MDRKTKEDGKMCKDCGGDHQPRPPLWLRVLPWIIVAAGLAVEAYILVTRWTTQAHLDVLQRHP